MSDAIQARPNLRDPLGKWDATSAEALLGPRSQVVADGATGGTAVAADRETTLFVSEEDTSAFTVTGLDLTEDGMPFVPRTFYRQGTQVVTVTLDQPIHGNTSYTLDSAGAVLAIKPYIDSAGAPQWFVEASNNVTGI